MAQEIKKDMILHRIAVTQGDCPSVREKVLRDKDIIEERKGELGFVDPVYRLWFSQEY